ncbi:MAG: hypothetical protein WD512_03260 [Candidatus Paceibacterota bacterium]
MDSKLLRQLDLYENDNLEALESLLSPSMSGGASDLSTVDEVLSSIGGKDEAMIRDSMRNRAAAEAKKSVAKKGGKKTDDRKDSGGGGGGISQVDKPINIIQSDEQVVHEVKSISDDGHEQITKVVEPAFPKITQVIKEEINRIATEWIKLDEGLEKLNDTRNEFIRQKKVKESAILSYIETYGLKDITKGRHQLVPKVVKGGKRTASPNQIKQALTEFLSEYNLGEDAAKLASEAVCAIEECREVGEDRVKLQHNKL